MLRSTSLEAALPLETAPQGTAETEPRPPKGEFEGWEVGEDDLT